MKKGLISVDIVQDSKFDLSGQEYFSCKRKYTLTCYGSFDRKCKSQRTKAR